MLKFIEHYRLPSGTIYIWETSDGSLVESTLMQDVSTAKSYDDEVRISLDPKIIWRHLVPSNDKLLMTVSTQKGCVHNCKFCDVAPLSFKGNLTTEEILMQLENMLNIWPPYIFKKQNEILSKKGKLGFAREGEPAHNFDNVIAAMKQLPKRFPEINWLPCFNSILPKKCLNGYSGEDVLRQVLEFKESECDGFLHLQISCNSTDEDKRKELFGGADVLPLEEVIHIINQHPVTTRTVALNFIVMEDVPVDLEYLKKLGLNGEKFVVKLIPLNPTNNGSEHNLKTYADYSTYDRLKEYTKQFEQAGIPVIMDSIARCESAGLCCGQLVQQYQ